MIKINPLASGSSGNCYHITDGSSGLLIEAGIPIQQIKKGLNFRLSEIDGVLVTHEHQDHCKAVEDVMRAGIDCYMSPGTAKALDITGHRLITQKTYSTFRINDWIIKSFEIEHDAAEPWGFLVWNKKENDKLAYITDSFYSKFKFVGVNYYMIECNYALDILNRNVESGRVSEARKNRVLKSHFSLENVKDFLRANDLSQVREIWLLHLSNDNSDEKRFKEEIQGLTGKPVYIA